MLLQDAGREDLVQKFPKNIGTAIGIELRDSTQTLAGTNDTKIVAGMTFNVTLGKFNGVL